MDNDLKPIPPIRPFQRFVIQNFPFIEKDFQDLDSYGLWCKVIEYVRLIADSQNECIDEVNYLADYVENYFKSLDVQEEINNKLDAMAESGELADIVAEYINLRGILAYDTVASMKTADNLVNGSFAETYGFYTKGDGGSAKYKVRTITNEDTVDEMKIIALADNTLIAELMLEPTMNVKQFGAKGDSSTDDTIAIQTALDSVSSIIVPSGIYMVDATESILPNTGNKIALANTATIKALPTDAGTYAVVAIDDVDNVEISGGTIAGDRNEHTGATGEWGHCISIRNGSDKIYIHDITIKDGWGDGIYFNDCSNVETARVHINNARRNGYSVIAITNYVSNDDFIENTNGTAPQAGVDIEPNQATDIIKNVTFNRLVCKNNTTTGFCFSMTKANTDADNIVVNDLISDGDGNGIYFQSDVDRTGSIILNNPLVKNTTNRAIFISVKGEKFRYELIRPIVTDYHTSTNSGHGIGLQGTNSNDIGNILIVEPTVVNAIEAEGTSSTYAVYVTTQTSTWKNLKIVDPINLDGRIIAINTPTSDCVITDKYGLFQSDANSNQTIQDTSKLLITSSSYTTNRNVTIRSGDNRFPVGTVITLINTGDYKMNMIMQDQYIYPLASTTGATVTLNDKGDTISIRRMSNDSWTVTNKNGNITVA